MTQYGEYKLEGSKDQRAYVRPDKRNLELERKKQCGLGKS